MNPTIEFIHPSDRARLEAVAPDASVAARLNELKAELEAANSTEAVLQCLNEGLKQVLQFQRLGFALLTDGGANVSSWRVITDGPTHWGEEATAPLFGSSLEALLQEGAIRIIHDLTEYQHLRPSSVATHHLIQDGMRSSLTIPLYYHDHPLGFLFFTSTTLRAFHLAHVALLMQLAPAIGHALGEALKPTTGLRRHFIG